MASVPNIIIKRIIHFIVAVNIISFAHGELFTAISEVEPLLETHQRIIDDLEDYIHKEEERLAVLKRHLNIYKREQDLAMEDIPNYLGNPINAFTLIKRLTTDLDHIEKSIEIGTEYIKNVTMSHEDVKYPTNEDLAGAAQALTRLQDTYYLNVEDLAEGKLNGILYSTPMSAGDCFELGKMLYAQKDYKNTLAWMHVTMRKYKEEGINYPFKETDIMEYIAFSHYLSGDVKSAYEWTLKVVAIDPRHPRAAGNLPHYQKTIAEQEANQKKQQRGETGVDAPEEDSSQPSWYHKERKTYESLCRGEMEIPGEVTKRLHCRYLTENHPFLRLAPIKMEYSYRDPDIIVFHGVMSDNEIEFVKNMSKPRFKRAVVHDPKTGDLVPAHYRISKSGWLHDSESDIIAKISRRVTDFTKLSMDTAEELQVVNYGIGGHYEPHYDFARRDLPKQNSETAFTRFNGNRIATVLFYMSDVAQGGATVFTELGLSVFPIKGAAVFWLNLHPSGQGDFATRHAACPVLRGSKWVSNKWIHQGGQELIMPCTLDFQEEGQIRKLPRAVPKSFR